MVKLTDHPNMTLAVYRIKATHCTDESLVTEHTVVRLNTLWRMKSVLNGCSIYFKPYLYITAGMRHLDNVSAL